MPLYEYKCQSCGDTFEVMQKFSDLPLTMHEACGGTVERLISAPALQFKGTGWYITDYARGGKSGETAKNGKAEGEAAPAKSGSGGEASAKPAESKPAAPAAASSADKS